MEKFKENLDVASSINILIRVTNKQNWMHNLSEEVGCKKIFIQKVY
jgi:hypothetical protein